MALPLQPIETPTELAALPLRSLVRELFKHSPAATDQGVVWERRRTGWLQISGSDGQSRKQPSLPVRLLWHPRWREVLT